MTPFGTGGVSEGCALLAPERRSLPIWRNRSPVYAAVDLDPLIAAMLTLPQIRQMVDRLFEAEQPWLGGSQPPHEVIGLLLAVRILFTAPGPSSLDVARLVTTPRYRPS